MAEDQPEGADMDLDDDEELQMALLASLAEVKCDLEKTGMAASRLVAAGAPLQDLGWIL